MTRSEEELSVGTREREAGRARLQKYVVTDRSSRPSRCRREEVRVEREPITDANVDDAMSGPELSEEEHEVVLHARRRSSPRSASSRRSACGSTRTSRPRSETVSEDVSREEIEVEGDNGAARATR